MYDGKQPMWARYGVALLAVAVACLVCALVSAGLTINVPPYSCLCAAVCVAAWYGGLHSAFFALLTGFACAVYFYVHSRPAAMPPDWETQVHAGIYLVSGSAIALLGGAMHAARNSAEQLAARAMAQTEQLQLEFATREQAVNSPTEARGILGTLLEYVPEGVTLVGGPPDYPILANSRFGQEFLGRPADEVIGLTAGHHAEAFGILLPDGVTRPQPEQMPLYRASRHGEIIMNEEWLIERPDGSRFTALFNVVPIRNSCGDIIGAVNCWRDISQRKQVEQALRELNQRKNDFLAILGHELRNPLAGILSSVQTLNRVGSQAPDAREMRGLIERQSLHMTRLIEDFLDSSRISHGKILLCLERLDLAPLVQRAAECHRAAMQQSGVSLALEIPKTPLWVDGDSVRLSQIVDNLLHNAAKFSKPGDCTTLTLSADGPQAVLHVRDTGIGMAPAQIRSLFEPFVQGQPAARRGQAGLGLGLALVKNLLELHQGSVEATSQGPGRGSTFTIRLRLQPAPEPAKTATGERREETTPRQVLIIEDSAEVARSLSMLLRVSGHAVAVAADGPTGIDKARQFRPDVVFCDISMPGGMDGYDVARALRADPATKTAYLIAITGFGQEDDRRMALEAGFDRHVTKPVVDTMLDALLADAPRASRSTTN